MDDLGPFGQWLRKRRKACGFSQEDLAEQVGCAFETVRKIEAGRRRPSRQMAELLAKALGATDQELPALIEMARFSPLVGEVAPYVGPESHASSLDHLHVQGGNLPAQYTSFIGRETQIEYLRELLRRTSVRLLTLTGAPGIGKTRLAQEVVSGIEGEFKDGSFFIPFSSISDHRTVIATIAQTFRIKEAPDQMLFTALASYLRDKELLLLLDNFEHIIEAASEIGELITACPSLHVFVTSRTALHIYGEQQFAVPPLSMPAAGIASPMALLARYEAMDLFAQRAQSVNPAFALKPEIAPIVAEICRQLDGLPLAIELAAARIKSLSPQEILYRLASRLKLLTGAPHDIPARQSTLRRAIAWSYDLLSAEEKMLFRRMSVFASGANLQAVEDICNLPGEPELDALEVITSLMDKSLVQKEEDEDRTTRYVMLRTIREYAREKLQESDEENVVRKLHALYYLELAEYAEPRLTSRERGLWLKWLWAEHDDLLAALDWSQTEAGDIELGLRLAGALGWYWHFHGHLAEGFKWLDGILARSEAANDSPFRAKVLSAAGRLAFLQMDHSAARVRLEEASSLLSHLGNNRELAYTRIFSAILAAQNGDSQGRSYISDSLALLERGGDRWGVAYALDHLAAVEYWLGDPDRAAQRYAESLALYRELDSRWDVAHELSALGHLAVMRGDYVAARVWLEEALQIEKEVGDRWDIAQTLRALGEAAQCQGDYDSAWSLYQESLDVYRQLGERLRTGALLRSLGHVMVHKREYQHAADLYEESLALFQELRHRWGVVLSLAARGGLARLSGQPERTATLLGVVAAQRDAMHQVMAPADLAEFETNLAATRLALSDESFSAAWSQGQAMTLEQALAYAVKEPIMAYRLHGAG
ncbi:MAG TPA: tetratricopeptide repeat protein [Chloroflexia bacterium]